MAAGLGFKTFTSGEVLTAADTNGYLMQGINVFANASARTAAITSPQEGQYSYLKDTNALEYYDGAAWVGAPVGDITAVTAGTGISGGGSSGDVTITNSMATTIDAKGDLIAGTADNAFARLAVGNNGETIVADSSTSTGLRYQGNFAAGKNKIINGDFGVWQRGTTFNAIGSNTYFADRFATGFVGGTGGHTINITRQTFTPGTAPVSGYESPYYLQVQRSVGGDDAYFGQKIEDVRTFAGQTVTFSFWARVTSGTFTPNRVFLNQQFGTGGSAEVDSIGLIQPTITTTWQRFSSTVAVPSIAGKTIGTGSSLWMLFQLGNTSTTATLQFWGWQVEASNTATAFQTATGTIQGELAACQRYYYDSRTADAQPPSASGIGQNVNRVYTNANFAVSMRVRPTVTLFSYANTAGKISVAGSASDVGSTVTAESQQITKNAFIQINDSGTGFVAATLYWFAYTANSEL